jgi:seryl-tRNA synthetase
LKVKHATLLTSEEGLQLVAKAEEQRRKNSEPESAEAAEIRMVKKAVQKAEGCKLRAITRREETEKELQQLQESKSEVPKSLTAKLSRAKATIQKKSEEVAELEKRLATLEQAGRNVQRSEVQVDVAPLLFRLAKIFDASYGSDIPLSHHLPTIMELQQATKRRRTEVSQSFEHKHSGKGRVSLSQ